MLVNAEFRGIKVETMTFKKDGKEEQMAMNTLYLEQLSPRDEGQAEAFSIKLRDEQVSTFSGCKRGDSVWIDISFRYVEDRASKIRGNLMSGVRLVQKVEEKGAKQGSLGK